MTLHFSGKAKTRSVSAILLLTGQDLTDIYSILVGFEGAGNVEDVSGNEIHVSKNDLGVTADEAGVTIPVFSGEWGMYRIILLDELSIAFTYAY